MIPDNKDLFISIILVYEINSEKLHEEDFRKISNSEDLPA